MSSQFFNEYKNATQKELDFLKALDTAYKTEFKDTFTVSPNKDRLKILVDFLVAQTSNIKIFLNDEAFQNLFPSLKKAIEENSETPKIQLILSKNSFFTDSKPLIQALSEKTDVLITTSDVDLPSFMIFDHYSYIVQVEDSPFLVCLHPSKKKQIQSLSKMIECFNKLEQEETVIFSNNLDLKKTTALDVLSQYLEKIVQEQTSAQEHMQDNIQEIQNHLHTNDSFFKKYTQLTQNNASQRTE